MLNASNRRTKMIWSLEGSCLSSDHVQFLKRSELDAVRLVYTAGEQDRICELLANFADVSPEKRKPVMVDFASRVRARIFGLEASKELAFGEKVLIGPKDDVNCDLQLDSDEWDQKTLFIPNAHIYIGFGNAVLKAISIEGDAISCEVMQGGVVHPGADVHIPETRKEMPLEQIVPTEDLSAFVSAGVDFILVPGVSQPEEVQALRKRLQVMSDQPPWVICKIDSDRVYEHYKELLPVVDGILISRLELALTVNPANIPILTKELVEGANAHAKVVFVASEMLGSMRHNATPTRAEVSDVANAVFDGADAVVSSEEIAHGTHSQRAANIMGRIVADVELQGGVTINWERKQPDVQDEMDAVAYGAFKTAERTKAKAIVCITENGNTALSLASYRPPVPIIAVTFSESVRRKLSLINGVTCIVLDASPTIDDVLPLVSDLLLRQSWLKVEDKIIFVSITLSSVGREASNLFTIQTLKDRG